MSGFHPLAHKGDLDRFRTEVRSWLEATVPADWQRQMADASEADYVRFQHWWFDEMKKVGLATPHWPAAWGGAELTLRHQILINEEIARIDAPRAEIFTISLYHLPATLFAHGTPAQRERHLAGVLERNEVWCQGFSEPGAGSDLASLRTRAERRGDRYIVNGQKVWSSYGMYADHYLLLARTDPNAPKKQAGISYFILDLKTKGVTVRPIKQASGVAEFSEVFLDDVEIPAENLIGAENGGWAIAQSTLSAERGLIVFELSERMARQLALDLADAKATDATWFRDDQFRREFVACYGEMRGLRLLIRRMLGEMAEHGEVSDAILAPLIKQQFADLLRRYTEFRLRVEGLDGQLRQPIIYGGGHQTRNWMFDFLQSYAWTISGGTNEIIKTIIAERGLGLPRG